MQDKLEIPFLKQRNWRIAALVTVFIIGFLTRLPHVTERGYTFHSCRQYRSALIARQFYYKNRTDTSEQQKRVLEAQNIRWLEPPVMERINAFLYSIAGGERIWIPRLLNILIWLAGGLGLYLIAVRLASIPAAIFALAFYLFLPYAMLAGRSFQPDPLMITLMIFSLYCIMLFHYAPSLRILIIAAAVSAAAIMIKPPATFFIIGVFLALMISRGNARREILSRNTIIFFAIALGLGLLYYVMSFLTSARITSQAGGSFIPQLIFRKFFYHGWHLLLGEIFGYPVLVVVLVGLFFVKPGTPRAFILGAWCAYIVFCLVFAYHCSTHSYYHLPLVPIAAISFGVLAGELAARAYNTDPQIIARVALLLICIFGLVRATRNVAWVDAGNAKEVAAAVEIGEKVTHSTKTIFLDWSYGQRLQFEGWFAGKAWLPSKEFAFAGKTIGDAASIFREKYVDVKPELKPEYFIVTMLEDFNRQRHLKKWLDDTYPLHTESDMYIIYDLREKKRIRE